MCIEPLNKLTADSACRTFLSNDVSFASFINAVVFEGNNSFVLKILCVMKMIQLLLSMIQKEQKIKKRKGYCR